MPQPDPAEFTVEAWLRPRTLGNPASGLRRTAVRRPGAYELYTQNVNRTSEVELRATVNLTNPVTGVIETVSLRSSPVPSGEWYHVGLTWTQSAGQLRLVVDGVVEDFSGGHSSQELRALPDRLYVGWNLGSQTWDGRIDELRVWHKQRSSSGLLADSRRRIDQGTDLVGVWHFDNDLLDAVQGNHGEPSTPQGSNSTQPTFVVGRVCPGDEFPGSRTDLELLTGVNATPDEIASKIARPGSAVTLQLRSPNGTYDNAPVYWLVQGKPNSAVPMNLVYPDVWLDLGADISNLTEGLVLPPGGITFPPIPWPAIGGLDVWVQGLVLDAAATDGFVTTNMHRLRQPLAVYVSSNGSATGTGTAADPIDSVTDGYAIARSTGAVDLLIASGTYLDEQPLFDRDINVSGGLDPNTWAATGSRSTLFTDHRGLRLRGIQGATTISGLEVLAAPGLAPLTPSNAGPDMASIALDARNCGRMLRIEDCRFEAGNGAPGADGANGASEGQGGQGGTRGTNGSPSPGQVPNGPAGGDPGTRGPNDGGRGGRGGYDRFQNRPVNQGFWNGRQGFAGDGDSTVSGGSRGAGGDGSSCGGAQPGDPGSPGDPGQTGNGGAPATATGGAYDTLTGSWRPLPVGDGVRGGAGGGGGGAGGGGGMRCELTGTLYFSGGGGGGGGSGGQGGDAGQGASEGGASIAVYLFDADPTFSDCRLVASLGGNGGRGGNGRGGGAGGAGAGGGNGWGVSGTFIASSGDGGRGGDGGEGGGGGGGGGGHGGPSWCVLRAGTAVFLDENSSCQFTTGTGGLGGVGGRSGQTGQGNNSTPAVDGQDGPTGLVGAAAPF